MRISREFDWHAGKFPETTDKDDFLFRLYTECYNSFFFNLNKYLLLPHNWLHRIAGHHLIRRYHYDPDIYFLRKGYLAKGR